MSEAERTIKFRRSENGKQESDYMKFSQTIMFHHRECGHTHNPETGRCDECDCERLFDYKQFGDDKKRVLVEER